jgi:2-methylisocitrate lyase-like PEP mutase family enzyme
LELTGPLSRRTPLSMTNVSSSAAHRLKARLTTGRILVTPGIADAHAARLSAMAGFEAVFMSGFGVAAARHGLPDTGQLSFGEMRDALRDVVATTELPVIADGDTGYGNAVQVKRTVAAYAQAGAGAVMIEDQKAPKRCGHVAGKEVVSRAAALERIKAAVDARNEGADILILARTDARGPLGLTEALERARAFHEIGADMIFVEAPQTLEEMRQVGALPGVQMANMLDGGLTPRLSPADLEAIGYRHVAYATTLLSAATKAMLAALEALKTGVDPAADVLPFARLKEIVGFGDYDRQAARYPNDET